ncbi:hypothetical protein RA8CHR_04897 [Variovorax sp. RA8]|nr:hypothetical protein RA8CHR_04897 [Variovorax sp. RA8]
MVMQAPRRGRMAVRQGHLRDRRVSHPPQPADADGGTEGIETLRAGDSKSHATRLAGSIPVQGIQHVSVPIVPVATVIPVAMVMVMAPTFAPPVTRGWLHVVHGRRTVVDRRRRAVVRARCRLVIHGRRRRVDRRGLVVVHGARFGNADCNARQVNANRPARACIGRGCREERTGRHSTNCGQFEKGGKIEAHCGDFCRGEQRPCLPTTPCAHRMSRRQREERCEM